MLSCRCARSLAVSNIQRLFYSHKRCCNHNTTPTPKLSLESKGRATVMPVHPAKVVCAGGACLVWVEAFGNRRTQQSRISMGGKKKKCARVHLDKKKKMLSCRCARSLAQSVISSVFSTHTNDAAITIRHQPQNYR